MRRTKQVFLFFVLSFSSLLLVLLSSFVDPLIFNGNSETAYCAAGGSETKRVAVLVFSSNPQSAEWSKLLKFIESAKTHFLGTLVKPSHNKTKRCNFIRATYFAFSSSSKQSQSLKDDVIQIQLTKPALEKGGSSSFNPCKIFVKMAGRSFQYFDEKRFDFVLVFEESVKVAGELDLADQLLTTRLAVLHKNFPNLKKLRSFTSKTGNELGEKLFISHVHLSSKIFGGSTKVVSEMCLALSDADGQSFHQRFNDYYQKNPPSVTVSTKIDGILEKNNVTFRQMEGLLLLPHYEPAEREYAKFLEAEDEQTQALIFQMAAQRIAEALTRNYITKVKHWNRTSPKFVTAFCPIDVNYCGGFGDRLRGVVNTFYLAIATGRFFHIDHQKPVDLAEYFDINEKLYNIPPNDYKVMRNQSRENPASMYYMGATDEFLNFLNDAEFSKWLRTYTSLDITTNRYTSLGSMLRNRKYASVIEKAAEYQTNTQEYGPFDYPIFISAALRAIVNKPSERLMNLFISTINSTVGFDLWNNSVKFGVQIRMESYSNFTRDHGFRVMDYQIKCFGDEIQRIVNETVKRSRYFNQTKDNNILVFATTDWPEAVGLLNASLANLPNVTLFCTGESQNFTVVHIDQANDIVNKSTADEAWLKVSKTYLDWYILTKMDFLLVSRSGFGETASMASLKPTKRFHHWEHQQKCPFHTYNTFFPSVVAFGPYLLHSL